MSEHLKSSLEHLGDAQKTLEDVKQQEAARSMKIRQEHDELNTNEAALSQLEILLRTLNVLGKLDIKLRTFSDYVQKRFITTDEGSIERSQIRDTAELVSKYVEAINDPDSVLSHASTDDVNRGLVDFAKGEYHKEHQDYASGKHEPPKHYTEEYFRKKIIVRASQKLEDLLDDFLQRKAEEQPLLRRLMHGGAVKFIRRKESKV